MGTSPVIPQHIRDEITRRCKALAAARAQTTYTQKEVAALAGVAQSLVSTLENAGNDPHLDRYLRVRLVLAGDERIAELGIEAAAAVEVARWRAVLRHARVCANLTQDEAGAKVGMTQAAVSRVEIGDPIPRLSTMLRLAEVVGADV